MDKNKDINEFLKKRKFVLLYRYNYLDDCYSCHLEEIEKIRDLIRETNCNNVLIIPNYKKSRENDILFSNELRDLNYLWFDERRVLIESIESNIPRYFAIMYTSLIIKEIFFPQKNLPDLTLEYLNPVKERYLSLK